MERDSFYAEDGRTNPKAEYEANIEAYQKDRKSYQCRFPARSFSRQNLNDPKPTFEHCEKLSDFFGKFEAKSISLSSSYFLDTPASAFGHTLLRFSNIKIKIASATNSSTMQLTTQLL